MKNLRLFKLVLIFAIIPFLFTVSCKKDNDDEPQKSKFEILESYLVDNNMDLSDILSGWIIPAVDVNENESNYYIMDIRSETDYNTGHITGAVNSTLGTIVSDAGNAEKPILVVCKTGQSAGHAVIALRLSGYSDAKVLKFGMSGWHSDFDNWTANCTDIGIGHTNWVSTGTATVSGYDDPTITTEKTSGAEILVERVAAMTSAFNAVDATTVLTTPDDYFINLFWDEADVTKYGHIAGAYRIKPLTLEDLEYNNLNPTKTIVTYCWTGQTSSMVTAYLTVLGYNAKSLKFGVNAMIHSELEFGKWTEDTPGDYDYVTTSK